MAVDTQNLAFATANAAATVTIPSFDPGAGPNRGLLVALAFADGSADQPAPTGLTVKYGGVSLTQLSGSNGIGDTAPNNFLFTTIFFLPSQPSSTPGNIVGAWTGSEGVYMVALAANGVDQTTFVNNGTSSHGTGTAMTLAVNSSGQDLTFSIAAGGAAKTLSKSLCDFIYVNNAATQLCSAASRGQYQRPGPGITSVPHGYTQNASDVWCISGANFLWDGVTQSSGGRAYEDRNRVRPSQIWPNGTGASAGQFRSGWVDDTRDQLIRDNRADNRSRIL